VLRTIRNIASPIALICYPLINTPVREGAAMHIAALEYITEVSTHNGAYALSFSLTLPHSCGLISMPEDHWARS
jgi:hypothetical protein